MNNEIKLLTDNDVRAAGLSPRVISAHGKREIAVKKASKNVTGTFVIHQPASALYAERFLVCLP